MTVEEFRKAATKDNRMAADRKPTQTFSDRFERPQSVMDIGGKGSEKGSQLRPLCFPDLLLCGEQLAEEAIRFDW